MTRENKEIKTQVLLLRMRVPSYAKHENRKTINDPFVFFFPSLCDQKESEEEFFVLHF